MRVIRSDGTIDDSYDKKIRKTQRLSDVWDTLHHKGLPDPRESNLRGIKAMVKGKRT